MIRVDRLVRDTVLNVVFGASKAALLLWVIRLISLELPAQALGVFLLSRRLSFTTASFLQGGVSQTLIRALPMSATQRNKEPWIAFAWLMWVLIALVVLAAAFLAPGFLTSFFFGSANVPFAVTQWTAGLIVASVLHFYAVSALFAERRVVASNVLEILSGSALLLVVLWSLRSRATVNALIGTQSIGMCLLSGALLAILWRDAHTDGHVARHWRTMARTVATYGVARALTPFLELLILSLTPWLTRDAPREAGALIIALSVLQIVQIAIVPLTQISSVVTAGLVGVADDERLQQGILILLGSAFFTCLLMTSILAPWAHTAIRLWLAKPDVVADVTYVIRALLMGILPLGIYYAVKGIIEVRWANPYNLWTLLSACCLQVVLYLFFRMTSTAVDAARIAITASFWSMGLLSLIWIRQYLPDVRFWGLTRMVAVALLLFVANLYARQMLGAAAMVPAVVASVCFALTVVLIRPSRFTSFTLSFVKQRVALR